METILARLPTSKEQVKRSLDERVRKRFNALFQKREPYIKKWKDIRDYQLPFLGMFEGEDNKEESHTDKIYSDATWEACQVMAAGIMSGLTPPSRQWFKLTMENQQVAVNSDAAKVLDERQNILMAIFAKSNFYNVAFSIYLELPFGQAPMGIFQDSEDGVRYVPYSIGSYAMDCGSNGKIEVFARKLKMTAEQIGEQFGVENCPDFVRSAIENGKDFEQSFTVNWLVDKNPDAWKGKLGPRFMPYRSIYWVEGSNSGDYLYIGGFEEWPVPVARHLVVGLEAYGKGPGWFALPDSKMLQKLELDKLMMVELGVKPPMQAPSSISGQINLFPGGITETDSGDIVKPLFDMRADMTGLLNTIASVEERIKRLYAADLFLMLDSLDNGSMTAREVMERTQEKLQQLGPVVERLLSEFLSPIIERTYAILDRGGVFPPIPEELQEELNGQEIKIEYISPLAQAQKMSSLVNIEQFWAFVTTLGQIDPTIFQKFDMVEAVNAYASGLGVPAKVLKTDDEYQQTIQAMQQAEAEAQMQQQQAEMIQQVPGIAQAAKVATEAANDGNPALQEWLGMGGA